MRADRALLRGLQQLQARRFAADARTASFGAPPSAAACDRLCMLCAPR